MNVFVLCQRNLVRSPIIEVILSKSLPEASVKSAGLEAVDGTEIPSSVKKIAEDWQLGQLKKNAVSVSSLRGEILDADLVVLAERKHQQYLNQIGYERKWISINDLVFDDSFVALDPFGFNLNEMKIEIAKIVLGTLRTVSYWLPNLKPSRIHTVIPNSPSDTGIAYAHALFEKSLQNSAIIDLDLRSPCAKEFSQNFSVIEYDPLEASPFSSSDASKNVIFTPYKEFSVPEKYLISDTLRKKIRELSEEIPVIQISAPRLTRSALLADSILAACDSISISRISC